MHPAKGHVARRACRAELQPAASCQAFRALHTDCLCATCLSYNANPQLAVRFTALLLLLPPQDMGAMFGLLSQQSAIKVCTYGGDGRRTRGGLRTHTHTHAGMQGVAPGQHLGRTVPQRRMRMALVVWKAAAPPFCVTDFRTHRRSTACRAWRLALLAHMPTSCTQPGTQR